MLSFLLAALLMQSPQEVRVSSHSYVPKTTLRVDTQEVEVVAVVRDAHGKLVPGLTKDDFRVLDQGKSAIIDHFSTDSQPSEAINDHNPRPAPEPMKSGVAAAPATQSRYLALFIDDVNGKDGSLGGDLKHTQLAAAKFVKEALHSGVRIGVFTASGQPTLDFTTDEAKLEHAIAALKPHVRMPEDGLTGCPRITPYLSYRIAYDRDRTTLRDVLYDSSKRDCPVTAAAAITQAEDTWRRVKEITADTLNSIGRVVDHLGAMPGKRELLMASSGFLAVSMQAQKDQVIGKALKAGVVISALDSKGIYTEAPPGSRPEDAVGYPTGGRGAAKAAQDYTTYETTELPFRLDTLNEPMENLAESTGGSFYHNNNDLAAGFRKLGEPPELTYRIGFRPDGVADGTYHKLKVTSKGYSVQARPGYLMTAETENLQSKIDREMLADDTETGFPIGIAVEQEKAKFSVVVTVDISKLRFAKDGDRQVQKIALTTALIDAQGKMVAAKESTMDFSLTDATFKRLSTSGLVTRVSFTVPAGKYKLRQVAEEAMDGKLACSSHPVVVR